MKNKSGKFLRAEFLMKKKLCGKLCGPNPPKNGSCAEVVREVVRPCIFIVFLQGKRLRNRTTSAQLPHNFRTTFLCGSCAVLEAFSLQEYNKNDGGGARGSYFMMDFWTFWGLVRHKCAYSCRENASSTAQLPHNFRTTLVVRKLCGLARRKKKTKSEVIEIRGGRGKTELPMNKDSPGLWEGGQGGHRWGAGGWRRGPEGHGPPAGAHGPRLRFRLVLLMVWTFLFCI